MSPYRDMVSSTWDEEELWLRLDRVIEVVMEDPDAASRLAFEVFMDSKGHADVRAAALGILAWCRDHA